MPFRTENTIYPTVFVVCKAHIVNISCRDNVFGHRYRVIPKTEIVNAVRAFGYGKERFTVGALHTDYQQVFTVPFDGTGIHCGINANTFH